MLKPSSIYPPLTWDANPKDYISLGSDKKRGDMDFIMSRGELVRFAANPWKWLKSERNKATKEMQWGSGLDCYSLTPSRFKDCYATCPETYPVHGMQCPKCGSVTDSQKCAKCKCDRVSMTIPAPWNWNASYCIEWRKERENEGLEPMSIGVLEEIRTAHSRLMEDPLIARVFEESEKQVQCVVEYHDKNTGMVVHIKTLLDLVPQCGSEFEQFLGDLKTTQDASIQSWEKTVYCQHYAEQCGLYLDAYNTVTEEQKKRTGFLHIVQENEEPYATARRMMSDEFLQIGYDNYRKALKFYCQCLNEGKFPGFDDMDDNSANPIVDGFRVTNPSSWMIA